ncbi:MAG TPA: TadE/TadG family type IV pilus assembly protein [Mesorhizobium sp.]|jgi:hypothetical protein|nr:TadE/TadG family type IV pilus assembly protein [Mesorhizobium sp.]
MRKVTPRTARPAPLPALVGAAKAFRRSREGNFAMITVILAPLLLGLVGGATDFFVLQHHRNELQATADAAVIAAAAEAGLKGWSEESAAQVAAAVIGSNLSNRFSGASFHHKVEVDEESRSVEIELTQDHYGYFVVGYFTGSPQIRVSASAKATGQSTICIIVQSPSGAESFKLSGQSQVVAAGCSAYSNSSDPKGIAARDGSKLTTQLACSAGGYSGKPGNFSPPPLTDCPSIKDPLAGRAALVDGLVAGKKCDFKALTIKNTKKTLEAGTYCGLTVTEKAEVTFKPGIYVIKDGVLRVDKHGSVAGTGVGFVFTGDKSKAEFKNDSSLSLSAPETGPMAGILLYAQSAGGKVREFKIESRNAQKLIGTVYLPKDRLTVGGDKDGDGVCDPEAGTTEDDDDDDDDGASGGSALKCESDVGAASSWTAIVTQKLNVTAGVDLVLNSDYASSPVPAPPGLGPNSSQIVLQN